MIKARHLSPVAVGVIASFAVVILLMILGASIAGSYALMIHYVHTFTVHQMQEQLRGATKSCHDIQVMYQASKGKFATALHDLYTNSQCPAILSGHYHPPS